MGELWHPILPKEKKFLEFIRSDDSEICGYVSDNNMIVGHDKTLTSF